MRHANRKHTLGLKSQHRTATMSNLAAALITHNRIETTLAKAKALRPFVEKVITLAKKAQASEDRAVKLHYRRLALARVRHQDAMHALFNEKVTEFTNRTGGYTRIYKLVPRTGDAADMALIELISADDEGYRAKKKSRRTKTATTAKSKAAPKAAVTKEEASENPSEVFDATEETSGETKA